MPLLSINISVVAWNTHFPECRSLSNSVQPESLVREPTKLPKYPLEISPQIFSN